MLPSFLTKLDPAIYESDNYVVLDWETDTQVTFGSAVHPENGIVMGSAKIGKGHPQARVGKTAVSGDHGPWSFWGSEFEHGKIVQAIEQADFLVAHNAKYELMWLKRCGLDLHDVLVFDTRLAEYVLLGNLAAGDDNMIPRATSLDMCCRRRGMPIKDPVVDLMMKSGVNPLSMPRAWLQGRCEQDVLSTETVFKDQLKMLKRTNRLGVLYTRCLLTPVLSEVEFEGMYLDAEAVEAEYEDYTQRFIDLSGQMNKLTGGINWNSPDQKAEFMYDTLGFSELKRKDGTPKRTPKGKRLTDKDTLEALKATNKRQREYVALKGKLGTVSSALSKNLEFFVGVVREKGGLFLGEFNQSKTATHRLSSSGIGLLFEMFEKVKKVQFQNLPRAFKKLFTARRKGWLICETDGSQLEFRNAAHLGRDEQARKDILDPRFDAHITSGAAMEDMEYDELYDLYHSGDKKAKQIRQDAKSETFKPLYGGKYGSKKQMRWYKAFAERYEGVAAAQGRWVQEVLRTKRLITEWGMRFYWPYAKVNNSGYINVETNVCNYPVQSFATAEIIPIAIVFFWHRVLEAGLQDKIKIVNTVHDSIICEVHPEAVEQYRQISIQAFTLDVYEYLEAVYNVKFDFVPLGVGITIGTHWSIGDEESYDVFYDGTMWKDGEIYE